MFLLLFRDPKALTGGGLGDEENGGRGAVGLDVGNTG